MNRSTIVRNVMGLIGIETIKIYCKSSVKNCNRPQLLTDLWHLLFRFYLLLAFCMWKVSGSLFLSSRNKWMQLISLVLQIWVSAPPSNRHSPLSAVFNNRSLPPPIAMIRWFYCWQWGSSKLPFAFRDAVLFGNCVALWDCSPLTAQAKHWTRQPSHRLIQFT